MKCPKQKNVPVKRNTLVRVKQACRTNLLNVPVDVAVIIVVLWILIALLRQALANTAIAPLPLTETSTYLKTNHAETSHSARLLRGT